LKGRAVGVVVVVHFLVVVVLFVAHVKHSLVVMLSTRQRLSPTWITRAVDLVGRRGVAPRESVTADLQSAQALIR
jgi:hypothetical protein